MNSASQVATVLYDGQCRFCCRQMERLRWWDRGKRFEFLSLHDPAVAQRWPAVDRDRLHDEMCIVDGEGHEFWGAGAVRYASRHLPTLWWLAPVMHIPGSMLLWRPLYRWVARNRYRFMGKAEECDTGSCRIHR